MVLLAVYGVCLSRLCLFIIKYILLGFVILVDRLLVGVSNGCFDKNHLTLINRRSYYQVNSVADKNVELQLLAARGMSKSRKKELFCGLRHGRRCT